MPRRNDNPRAADGHRLDRVGYECGDPLYHLARIAIKTGPREEALRYLHGVLDRTPEDPRALALLFALTDRAEYRERLQDHYSELDAALLIGGASLWAGNAAAALSALSPLAEALPEYRTGLIYHAIALGLNGQHAAAIAAYGEAMAKAEDPVMQEAHIIAIFRAAAEADRSDASAWRRYARVLLQFGRYDGAIDALKRVQGMLPDAQWGLQGEIDYVTGLRKRAVAPRQGLIRPKQPAP